MIDPRATLRDGLLGLGRSGLARRVISRTPVSRSIAGHFVAGESESDCVDTVSGLLGQGRLATVDFLTGSPLDEAHAIRTRDAYLSVIAALHDHRLTADGRAEVTVRLGDLGRALPENGPQIALDGARRICEAAAGAGTTVTVEAERHIRVEATLRAVHDLRADFPWVGVAVDARLRRAEADCRDLAATGSRVRLSRGTGKEPDSVAYQDDHEIDLCFVRCLKVLMEGPGHPIVATSDPDLIEIGRSLSDKQLRAPDSFEFQLPLGIRLDQQERFAAAGHRMRVRVPYGDEWPVYVTRLLIEHPGSLLSPH